jgi:hypothetical protein
MKNLWRILEYEFQMYYAIEVLQEWDMKNRPRDPEQLTGFHQVLTNALTEVKILHIRVLTGVFLRRNPELSEDLNIDDLLPEWRSDNLGLVEALYVAYNGTLSTGDSPRGHMNKFLAHATKSRGRGFNWTPVTEAMDPPLRAIFSTLPIEHLPTLAVFRDK